MNYFFENTDQLREYVPVTEAFTFKEIKPVLETVSTKYLRNDFGIGQPLFDSIHEDYNTGIDALPDIKKKLIHHIRHVVAKMAMSSYVSLGVINIGKDGISNIVKENREPIKKWQKDQLQEKFLNEGFDALDILLYFLEENKASFGVWTASNAYTLTKDQFINSVEELKFHYTLIQSRRTFLFLKPFIRRAGDFQVKEILGDTLFTDIKSQIHSGSLSPTNKSLLNIIQPAVANLCVRTALDQLLVKLTDNGIQIVTTVSNTDNSIESKTLSETHVKRLKEGAESTASMYLLQLKKLISPDHPGVTGSRNNDPDSKTYYV